MPTLSAPRPVYAPIYGKTSRLWLTSLTHSQHMRTCGYWYVVTEGGTPHTAFATKAGVLQWANERGLTILETLPNPGTHGDLASGIHTTQDVRGCYRKQSHMDAQEFDAIKPLLSTRDMSNGDWVEAKVTEDADGIRTVHTLNPNVRTRHVFDYAESRALMS